MPSSSCPKYEVCRRKFMAKFMQSSCKKSSHFFVYSKNIANFADGIYKVVSMSKTLYSLALSSVISLDITAMSLPPHFSAGSGMAKLGGTGCHRGKVTSQGRIWL